jgi:hypothetical protein
VMLFLVAWAVAIVTVAYLVPGARVSVATAR